MVHTLIQFAVAEKSYMNLGFLEQKWFGRQKDVSGTGYIFYYIPISDTSFELSVFWPSDTESRINELRFSDSISLSFKTRLTLVTCLYGNVK